MNYNASGNDTIGIGMNNNSNTKSKYEKIENEICLKHDHAVETYKNSVLKADIWNQRLYGFMNQNLPSGIN